MVLFDAYAGEYDDWYEQKIGKYVDQIQKAMIDRLAKPKEGEAALDLGAGTGNYSLWLAQKGLHVTGLDQSSRMLACARKKRGGEKVHWTRGDANALPFETGSFDLVLSVTSLEFMDQPALVLSEAMRVLKPRGRLIAGLIARDGPWGQLYIEMARKNPTHLFASAHFFREKEIEELLPGAKIMLLKGLYLPPVEEFDEVLAREEERRLAETKDAPGAGFFAVRWDKNAEKKE